MSISWLIKAMQMYLECSLALTEAGIENTWSWYICCFPVKEAGKWCYKFLEELRFYRQWKW